jgi:hypothetical protein
MEMRAWPRYYPTQPILATVLEGDFPCAQAVIANISVSGARLITDVTISPGIYVKLSLWARNKPFLKTDALVLWSSAATAEAGDAIQGVLFTHRSTTFRQRMERLLTPPAFVNMNLVKMASGGETPIGDEIDWVTNDLLRDFELFSRHRKD